MLPFSDQELESTLEKIQKITDQLVPLDQTDFKPTLDYRDSSQLLEYEIPADKTLTKEGEKVTKIRLIACFTLDSKDREGYLRTRVLLNFAERSTQIYGFKMPVSEVRLEIGPAVKLYLILMNLLPVGATMEMAFSQPHAVKIRLDLWLTERALIYSPSEEALYPFLRDVVADEINSILSKIPPAKSDEKSDVSQAPARKLEIVSLGCDKGQDIYAVWQILRKTKTMPIERAIGIDINPTVIATAQKEIGKKTGFKFIVGDATNFKAILSKEMPPKPTEKPFRVGIAVGYLMRRLEEGTRQALSIYQQISREFDLFVVTGLTPPLITSAIASAIGFKVTLKNLRNVADPSLRKTFAMYVLMKPSPAEIKADLSKRVHKMADGDCLDLAYSGNPLLHLGLFLKHPKDLIAGITSIRLQFAYFEPSEIKSFAALLKQLPNLKQVFYSPTDKWQPELAAMTKDKDFTYVPADIVTKYPNELPYYTFPLDKQLQEAEDNANNLLKARDNGGQLAAGEALNEEKQHSSSAQQVGLITSTKTYEERQVWMASDEIARTFGRLDNDKATLFAIPWTLLRDFNENKLYYSNIEGLREWFPRCLDGLKAGARILAEKKLSNLQIFIENLVKLKRIKDKGVTKDLAFDISFKVARLLAEAVISLTEPADVDLFDNVGGEADIPLLKDINKILGDVLNEGIQKGELGWVVLTDNQHGRCAKIRFLKDMVFNDQIKELLEKKLASKGYEYHFEQIENSKGTVGWALIIHDIDNVKLKQAGKPVADITEMPLQIDTWYEQEVARCRVQLEPLVKQADFKAIEKLLKRNHGGALGLAERMLLTRLVELICEHGQVIVFDYLMTLDGFDPEMLKFCAEGGLEVAVSNYSKMKNEKNHYLVQYFMFVKEKICANRVAGSAASAFHQSIKEGRLEDIKRYANDGRDINHVDWKDFGGRVALYFAICFRPANYIEVIKYLLEKKARVNATIGVHDNFTVFHYAVICGDLAAVKILLPRADLTAEDSLGRNPVHSAVLNGSKELVFALLDMAKKREQIGGEYVGLVTRLLTQQDANGQTARELTQDTEIIQLLDPDAQAATKVQQPSVEEEKQHSGSAQQVGLLLNTKSLRQWQEALTLTKKLSSVKYSASAALETTVRFLFFHFKEKHWIAPTIDEFIKYATQDLVKLNSTARIYAEKKLKNFQVFIENLNLYKMEEYAFLRADPSETPLEIPASISSESARLVAEVARSILEPANVDLLANVAVKGDIPFLEEINPILGKDFNEYIRAGKLGWVVLVDKLHGRCAKIRFLKDDVFDERTKESLAKQLQDKKYQHHFEKIKNSKGVDGWTLIIHDIDNVNKNIRAANAKLKQAGALNDTEEQYLNEIDSALGNAFRQERAAGHYSWEIIDEKEYGKCARLMLGANAISSKAKLAYELKLWSILGCKYHFVQTDAAGEQWALVIENIDRKLPVAKTLTFRSQEPESLFYRHIRAGNLGAIKQLVGNRTDVNDTNGDPDGRTVLYLAISLYWKDNKGIIQYLLEQDAQCNAWIGSPANFTVFHYAIMCGNLAAVKILLPKANLAVTNNLGRNPVHSAVLNGNNELISDLLKAANTNLVVKLLQQKDKDGKTPRDLTTNAEIIKILDSCAPASVQAPAVAPSAVSEQKQQAEPKASREIIVVQTLLDTIKGKVYAVKGHEKDPDEQKEWQKKEEFFKELCSVENADNLSKVFEHEGCDYNPVAWKGKDEHERVIKYIHDDLVKTIEAKISELQKSESNQPKQKPVYPEKKKTRGLPDTTLGKKSTKKDTTKKNKDSTSESTSAVEPKNNNSKKKPTIKLEEVNEAYVDTLTEGNVARFRRDMAEWTSAFQNRGATEDDNEEVAESADNTEQKEPKQKAQKKSKKTILLMGGTTIADERMKEQYLKHAYEHLMHAGALWIYFNALAKEATLSESDFSRTVFVSYYALRRHIVRCFVALRSYVTLPVDMEKGLIIKLRDFHVHGQPEQWSVADLVRVMTELMCILPRELQNLIKNKQSLPYDFIQSTPPQRQIDKLQELFDFSEADTALDESRVKLAQCVEEKEFDKPRLREFQGFCKKVRNELIPKINLIMKLYIRGKDSQPHSYDLEKLSKEHSQELDALRILVADCGRNYKIGLAELYIERSKGAEKEQAQKLCGFMSACRTAVRDMEDHRFPEVGIKQVLGLCEEAYKINPSCDERAILQAYSVEFYNQAFKLAAPALPTPATSSPRTGSSIIHHSSPLNTSSASSTTSSTSSGASISGRSDPRPMSPASSQDSVPAYVPHP